MAMMRAVTCDEGVIKRLKSIIDGSEALLTEIELVLTKDGIQSRQLDDRKACMLHWNIPSSALIEYEYTSKDKEIVITIGTEELKRATVTAKTRLEFLLDTEDTTHGHFTVIGHSDFRHQEVLPLLIPRDERSKKPILPYTVGMTVKGKTLKSILKSIMKVTRSLTLTVEEKNKIVFEGEGDSGEFSAEVETDPDDCVHVSAYCNEKAVTMYDVGYLHLFRKFVLGNDAVFLEFATKKPVKLSMVDSYGIEVELILAPRVGRSIGVSRANVKEKE